MAVVGKPTSIDTAVGDILPSDDPAVDTQIAKNDAYVEAAIARGVDPAQLQRVEIAASLVAQPLTLDAAVTAATAVVLGKVVSLHFTTRSTIATVRIESIAKNRGLAVGQDTQVQLGCVLQPNEAMTSVLFACDPGAPVVLPGSEAMMFLSAAGTGSVWNSGLGTEVLPVAHGVITPQDPSFGLEKQASGVRPAVLLTRLRAAAG